MGRLTLAGRLLVLISLALLTGAYASPTASGSAGMLTTPAQTAMQAPCTTHTADSALDLSIIDPKTFQNHVWLPLLGSGAQAQAQARAQQAAFQVHVGQTLVVTTKLYNLGCGDFALPQHRLWLTPDGQQALSPAQPEPILHMTGIAPEGADSAKFYLTAVAPGTVEVSFGVSFKVHLSSTSPGYWGYSGAGPLVVEVLP